MLGIHGQVLNLVVGVNMLLLVKWLLLLLTEGKKRPSLIRQTSYMKLLRHKATCSEANHTFLYTLILLYI
jgi:hypothetical protein